MADHVSPQVRSAIMRAVGTSNTGAEIAVRKLLHSWGYRFSLHRRDLPGSPDIVLPSQDKVVFVHGCFWHGHGCPKGRLPKTRTDYWANKVSSNKTRDRRVQGALRKLGWEVTVVWQCELRRIDSLSKRLRKSFPVRTKG